ncbi:MAG TPA: response regulator [Gammaproteobacteria bacterium]|nr:response regulator [Gammaproteobacteria bacterium]
MELAEDMIAHLSLQCENALLTVPRPRPTRRGLCSRVIKHDIVCQLGTGVRPDCTPRRPPHDRDAVGARRTTGEAAPNRKLSPGLRILVVEDEMMLAMLMEDWLAMLDCEVVKVPRLKKALALAKDGDFDGALLDVNLGGEECYPVAEVLDKRGIPYIFMTGYSANMLRENFLDRPRVQKPFQLEEIEQLMVENFEG